MQNRSVPMEPDRDERMPWSGHPAKTSESEAGSLMWPASMRTSCTITECIKRATAAARDPNSVLAFNSKDIIWPSVATIIPDWYYNFYGDDEPLRDNYDMMNALSSTIASRTLNPITR